jgi:hypothetical protein
MQRYDMATIQWITGMSLSIRDRVQQSTNQSITDQASMSMENNTDDQSNGDSSPDDGFYDDDVDTFMTQTLHQSNGQSFNEPYSSPFAGFRTLSAPNPSTKPSNIQSIDQSVDQSYYDTSDMTGSIEQSRTVIQSSDQSVNRMINDLCHQSTSLSVDSSDSLISRSLIDSSFYEMLNARPIYHSPDSVNHSINHQSTRSIDYLHNKQHKHARKSSNHSIDNDLPEVGDQSPDQSCNQVDIQCTKFDQSNNDDFYDRDECVCPQCSIFDQSINQSVHHAHQETVNRLRSQPECQPVKHSISRLCSIAESESCGESDDQADNRQTSKSVRSTDSDHSSGNDASPMNQSFSPSTDQSTIHCKTMDQLLDQFSIASTRDMTSDLSSELTESNPAQRIQSCPSIPSQKHALSQSIMPSSLYQHDPAVDALDLMTLESPVDHSCSHFVQAQHQLISQLDRLSGDQTVKRLTKHKQSLNKPTFSASKKLYVHT